MAGIRRNVLAAQVGGLLGYLGHRVLGQYDLFLPADDDGLIYFVGPNIAGVERKFGFEPRDFRLWLSLHEVAHRLQFADASWLRGHLLRLGLRPKPPSESPSSRAPTTNSSALSLSSQNRSSLKAQKKLWKASSPKTSSPTPT